MTRTKQAVAWWIALAIFLLWSGWLSWQVWLYAHPNIVSLPQLHLAQLIVEADVPEAKNDAMVVTIKQVVKGKELLQTNPSIPAPGGRKIIVMNLAQSKGWQGPGLYLLPLYPMEPKGGELPHFYVVPIPISPGFYYTKPEQIQKPIYIMSDDIRQQVQKWLKTP